MSDPDLLYAAPPMVACAVPASRDRMKFVDPDRPNRKSGGMGREGFVVD
jgi:hypothetical protein